MKLLCAILGIMLACLAANAADVDILALHKQLQAEEPRLAAMTPVKAQSLHQPNYQPKYAGGVQYKHGPRYADDKYEVIHIKLPKGSSHIDTYEKPEYKSEHEEPEYKPKYDEPEYKPEYDGTEYKHKYDKAEHKYDHEETEYKHKYDQAEHTPEYEETEYKHQHDKAEYKPEYEETEYKSKDTGYGYSKKATLKLWEKSRTAHRAQEDNADTYQFSPKKAKEAHGEDDGLIAMPINEDLKVLPVGVCEWTVTKVQPRGIAEHATIMGSSNVVCTFTEEAEKQCDTDVLCEGMSVSGQGLLYHFDKDPLIYSDAAYKGDAEVDMDAMLTIINGVHGGKKKHVYTNGAIQFVYDAEPEEAPVKATGAEKKKEKKDAPQYTFVFKH